MLILTRRIGESILIDDNISIKVLGIKGQQVRLGIHAPKEVSVHRQEIYLRIQREKQQVILISKEEYDSNNEPEKILLNNF